MDVRNFLSNTFRPKDPGAFSASDIRPRGLISLIGYGADCNTSHLAIETNLGTFSMVSSRYPHYANWTHALDELLVENSGYLSINRIGRFIQRFIRAISIGASRGNHFTGIWNGFIYTALVPHESTYIKLICSSDSTIHISRTASRAGLVVIDFSKEMERAFRRGFKKNNFYVTSAKSSSAHLSRSYPDHSFPNLAHGICSSRIELSHKDLQARADKAIKKVNSYLRLIDTSITPQGIAFQVDADGSVNLLDLETTHYWPSALWKSEDGEKFLSPTVMGVVEVIEKASFMTWSKNWAHFVEDNLPSVLGLIQEDPLRPIFTSGIIGSAQRETLETLFSGVTFEPMLEGYVYKFEDVLVNLHNDSRNTYIAGNDSDLEMVDEVRLREIRSQSLAAVESELNDDLKLYISREAGFRRLINREAVENIFRDQGFIILKTEDMGFVERVKMFQSAQIVAGETGAGLVNLYFCKNHTKVIEIAHPSVSQSREHHPLVRITAHEYHKLHGKKIGISKKLRYGSDAYIADEREIRRVLQKLNHKPV